MLHQTGNIRSEFLSGLLRFFFDDCSRQRVRGDILAKCGIEKRAKQITGPVPHTLDDLLGELVVLRTEEVASDELQGDETAELSGQIEPAARPRGIYDSCGCRSNNLVN